MKKISERVGMISPFPEKGRDTTNFSALAGYTKTLLKSLGYENKEKFVILAQRNNSNKEFLEDVDSFTVSYVWRYNNPLFFLDIFSEVVRLRLKIVHIQHEVFVFGKKQYVYPYLFILLLLLFRIIGVKVVNTIHGVIPLSSVNKDFSESNKVTAPLCFIKFGLKLMYKCTCKFSNYIIVHNEKLKKLLINDYSIRKDKVFVIPHPLYRYESKGNYPESLNKLPSEAKKIVLFFGFLAPYKGLDTLVKAAVTENIKNEDIYFLIVGSTPKRYIEDQNYTLWLDNLKKISKENEKIIWIHEYIPDEEIAEYFKKANLVVVPYSEAMSASGPLSISVYHEKSVLVSRPFRGVVEEDLIYGDTIEDLVLGIKNYFNDNNYRLSIEHAVIRQKDMWSDDVIILNMSKIYLDLATRV